MHHLILEKVKLWYDGYNIDGYDVYNPKAVVSRIMKEKFKSYWSQTGTYEAVVPLINMDFDEFFEQCSDDRLSDCHEILF